jgi:hypothetical protein
VHCSIFCLWQNKVVNTIIISKQCSDKEDKLCSLVVKRAVEMLSVCAMSTMDYVPGANMIDVGQSSRIQCN